ncbi:peptidylprolyl isomerase [Chengkuizengella sediminis]|uniref:peptidylprolyl isomerase n=1 Tax=Chengkuizengella sediminis TaxID=1885917 RepID=UPI001389410D|nr:peptidylprolyl isomerase [Chengkuizengella sediminis]NDI33918.1 peptidylprolyl isomerase PrsA [Chengkuizengella sediminis]
MRKLILLLFLSVLLLSSCTNTSSDDSEVIAETKFGNVTKSEMYDLMKEHYGEKILSDVLYDKILSQDYTVTQQEIEKALDDLKEQLGLSYLLVLKQLGLHTDEQIKEMLRIQILQQKAVLENIEVKENEIREHYDNLVPEVKLSQIVVKDEETVKEMEQKLDEGASFEELAKEYSTDADSATKGGNIGWHALELGTDLEKNLSSLDIEEVSSPIKEGEEYFIIKITDRQAMKSFDEMRNEIEDELKLSKVKPEDIVTALQDKIDQADIKIKDDDLKDVFSDLENTVIQ